MTADELYKLFINHIHVGTLPDAPKLPKLEAAYEQRLPVGAIVDMAINKTPDGFLACDGSAYDRTIYPRLFSYLCKSATVTFTLNGVVNPGLVNWASHGLLANDPIKFTSTGGLPTTITAGTTYYVVGSSITENSFQISNTPSEAGKPIYGIYIGTVTGINAPWGDGDGSTTFNVPDFRDMFVRGLGTSRSFGSYQEDNFQGHKHEIENTDVMAVGGATVAAGRSFAMNYVSPAIAGTIITDGTNGTPRIGSETRPKNIAILKCIKY